MRIELQPAYILHTRPYRDTSLLVDFLTPEYGRVSAVVRGVRQRKGGKRSLLNPFNQLLISWQGKRELKLLTGVEADGPSCFLAGAQIYSGFYLNELLIRLLPEMDAHPALFYIYQDALSALQANAELEPLLRCFELNLLQELGYAMNFAEDAQTGHKILQEENYRFDAQSGFYHYPLSNVQAKTTGSSTVVPCFSGDIILAIGARDFSQTTTRLAAKRLSRLMLQPLLGSRSLKSRELFMSASPN